MAATYTFKSNGVRLTVKKNAHARFQLIGSEQCDGCGADLAETFTVAGRPESADLRVVCSACRGEFPLFFAEAH